MEQLKQRCSNHELYPKHLQPGSKNLENYYERLSQRSDVLFCRPDAALLEFLDLSEGEIGE
jgi:hypothetical protein